jgi:ParB family chromosome partitioning protein
MNEVINNKVIIGRPLMVAVNKITLNPEQPRKNFIKTEITKLADSIKLKGIIEPLVVRINENLDTYQLIAGQRRLMAAKEAGIKEVPVVIINIKDDPKQRLELAMLENIIRNNLNPIEEAEGYSRLENEFKHNILDIAKLFGKDRSTIINSIRLLNLPEVIKDDIRYGRMTAGHGRAILSISDPKNIIEIRSLIISKSLSVRETENLVKKLNKKIKILDTSNKAFYESLELSISERLGGLKVFIKYKGDNKRIDIYLNNDNDINNLYNILNN